MFVSTYAGAVAGIDAVKVTVEVNLTGGGLGLYLVGLPDNAVKESEQRIRRLSRIPVARCRAARSW